MKSLLKFFVLSIFLTSVVYSFSGTAFANSTLVLTDSGGKVWDFDQYAGETINWSGKIDKDGYCTGKGIMQWLEKGTVFSRYEGEMLKGKRNGKGKMTWLFNNESYDGDWVNNETNGQGIWILYDGERYEGKVKNGVRDGKGFVTWPPTSTSAATRYEAEWSNGKDIGGIYTWLDGSRHKEAPINRFVANLDGVTVALAGYSKIVNMPWGTSADTLVMNLNRPGTIDPNKISNVHSVYFPGVYLAGSFNNHDFIDAFFAVKKGQFYYVQAYCHGYYSQVQDLSKSLKDILTQKYGLPRQEKRDSGYRLYWNERQNSGQHDKIEICLDVKETTSSPDDNDAVVLLRYTDVTLKTRLEAAN